ncbi:MAG: septum formation protein Maf [Pelagibacteraceae bacterium]|nr:septum formation protein Maf [Pelagibacteraceae bacterium]|tara:strand:- start:8032 stop:8619 length:588 start_codon:yes stop_codon:yes gene_type:complete
MSKPLVVLASKSPRRETILKKIGLKFEIIPSNILEKINPEISPKKLAEFLSQEKAEKVSENNRNKIIIGADTIVYLDKVILGKPRNKDESYRMLKSLSGKTHNVITGVSIIHKNKGVQETFSQITKVTVRNIPSNELLYYIDNYSTLDKAGGYGIQDWFSVWIKKIDGCYYNVMGLPLSKFYKIYSLILNDIKNQ